MNSTPKAMVARRIFNSSGNFPSSGCGLLFDIVQSLSLNKMKYNCTRQQLFTGVARTDELKNENDYDKGGERGEESEK